MDDSSFKAMADEIEGLLGIDRNRFSTCDFSTKAVHGYRALSDRAGSVSQPIYQTATFAHPGLHRSTGFAYSRCGNPTVLELEDTVALLEGGWTDEVDDNGLSTGVQHVYALQAETLTGMFDTLSYDPTGKYLAIVAFSQNQDTAAAVLQEMIDMFEPDEAETDGSEAAETAEAAQ